MSYYKCVSIVTKDCILGKAWEAQLAMLIVRNKCWVGSVKKCDALLSPGVNPLKGSPRSSCGKLRLGGTLPASNSKKG